MKKAGRDLSWKGINAQEVAGSRKHKDGSKPADTTSHHRHSAADEKASQETESDLLSWCHMTALVVPSFLLWGVDTRNEPPFKTIHAVGKDNSPKVNTGGWVEKEMYARQPKKTITGTIGLAKKIPSGSERTFWPTQYMWLWGFLFLFLVFMFPCLVKLRVVKNLFNPSASANFSLLKISHSLIFSKVLFYIEFLLWLSTFFYLCVCVCVCVYSPSIYP